MKTFKIPVTWEMYGHYNIKAESLEEAKKKAVDSDLPLPENCDYVSESIKLDDGEIILEMNK